MHFVKVIIVLLHIVSVSCSHFQSNKSLKSAVPLKNSPIQEGETCNKANTINTVENDRATSFNQVEIPTQYGSRANTLDTSTSETRKRAIDQQESYAKEKISSKKLCIPTPEMLRNLEGSFKNLYLTESTKNFENTDLGSTSIIEKQRSCFNNKDEKASGISKSNKSNENIDNSSSYKTDNYKYSFPVLHETKIRNISAGEGGVKDTQTLLIPDSRKRDVECIEISSDSDGNEREYRDTPPLLTSNLKSYNAECINISSDSDGSEREYRDTPPLLTPNLKSYNAECIKISSDSDGNKREYRDTPPLLTSNLKSYNAECIKISSDSDGSEREYRDTPSLLTPNLKSYNAECIEIYSDLEETKQSNNSTELSSDSGDNILTIDEENAVNANESTHTKKSILKNFKKDIIIQTREPEPYHSDPSNQINTNPTYIELESEIRDLSSIGCVKKAHTHKTRDIFQQENKIFTFISRYFILGLCEINATYRTKENEPNFKINLLIDNFDKFDYEPKDDLFSKFPFPQCQEYKKDFKMVSVFIEFLTQMFIYDVSIENEINKGFVVNNLLRVSYDLDAENRIKKSVVSSMFNDPIFKELAGFVPQLNTFLLEAQNLPFKSMLDAFRGYSILYLMYINVEKLKIDLETPMVCQESNVFNNTGYIRRVIALDCMFYVFVSCLKNNETYLQNALFVIWQSVVIKPSLSKHLKGDENVAITRFLTKNLFFCIRKPYISHDLSDEKSTDIANSHNCRIIKLAHTVIHANFDSEKILALVNAKIKNLKTSTLPTNEIITVLGSINNKQEVNRDNDVAFYSLVLHYLFTIENKDIYDFQSIRAKMLATIKAKVEDTSRT